MEARSGKWFLPYLMVSLTGYYYAAVAEAVSVASFRALGYIGDGGPRDLESVWCGDRKGDGYRRKDLVYRETEPVRYGDGVVEVASRALKVRAYVDGLPSAAPRPLVLVFPDSKFEGTGRLREPACLAHFGSRGFVVCVADHRGPHEGGRFPGALRDAAAAARCVAERAAELGGDPGRVCVVGEGSGAWLAAMLAVAAGGALSEDLTGGPAPPVRAAIVVSGAVGGFERLDAQAAGWAAASHEAPQSPISRFLGGPPASLSAWCGLADPSAHATDKTPPVKIYHGDADPIIPCAQARAFYGGLRAATPGHATKHRLRILEGAGHGTPHFASLGVVEDQRAFLAAALLVK